MKVSEPTHNIVVTFNQEKDFKKKKTEFRVNPSIISYQISHSMINNEQKNKEEKDKL